MNTSKRQRRSIVSLRSDVADWREPLPEDAAVKSEIRDAVRVWCRTLEGPIGSVARELYAGNAASSSGFSRTHRAHLSKRARCIAAVSLSRFKQDV